MAQLSKGISKFVLALVQLSFGFCAGSLDVGDAPASCDFHKIPWHNTDEFHSKWSLVVEIKDMELNPDSKNNGKRKIINVDPTTTIAITTIQPEELAYPKEGERLFHSQMWVKWTPLHFIVDRGS
jgi:hypothetical protein